MRRLHAAREFSELGVRAIDLLPPILAAEPRLRVRRRRRVQGSRRGAETLAVRGVVQGVGGDELLNASPQIQGRLSHTPSIDCAESLRQSEQNLASDLLNFSFIIHSLNRFRCHGLEGYRR